MEKVTNAKLLKTSNFKEIEDLCEKIINSHNVKLQIPNTLQESGIFGLEGAALQLFGTWLRKEQNRHVLHTSIQDAGNEDSFTDLCNSLFGLICLRMAEKIISVDKKEVDRYLALKPAHKIFNSIREEKFNSAYKGFYLGIPAIKSPTRDGKDREFDSPLYNQGEVVGAGRFLEIVHKIIDFIVPQKSSSSVLNEEIISNISEIVRELFTNTHRHARTDFRGNSLKSNFRAISFRSHDVTPERLSKLIQSGGGDLAMFLADWNPKDDHHLRVLDITVVDSGPGYARRWTGLDKDEITIEQEKEAIVKCFMKNNSTASEDSSGSGLSNVLRDLNMLKGWFRLRTGSILLERSFFNNKGSTTIEVKDLIEKTSFLEGVVFNIVIPLRKTQGDN
ncbi:hypothetical protein [Cellvibrio sp. UBA7671]|uniref:hypothetical protein n=1 Tax=Cellvibrio sp. UBA7671 TaxID=1946312 RepID=UPI002F351365